MWNHPKNNVDGNSKQCKRDKLSGYLTKHIGKEFEEAKNNAKKYWHLLRLLRGRAI
jgi:hypothetical protein